MLEQRIQQQFFESADLKYASAEGLARPIAGAASAVVGCITGGGKVLACGHGGSASDAERFAAELVGRFERERPGLAAIALSTRPVMLDAFGDEHDLRNLYAKQVLALGAPGDVLVALTISGQAESVLQAIAAAHTKEMTVVVLSGRDGGRLAELLLETDVHIHVGHDRGARVQEVHHLALHCVCDAVDLQLLGEQENT